MSNFGYQVLGFGSNVNPTGGILYSMSFPATFSSTVTGRLGPTQYTEVNRPTTDTNYFSLSGGIQLWTPPETRDYTIYMRGAVGGQHSGTFGSAGAFPGAGAEATFTMALDNTKTYAIVVGQRPSSIYQSGNRNGSAGGGCSAIYENGFLGDADTSKIIGIVGGGGGTGHGYTGYATAGVGRGGSATTDSNELNANAYVYVDAVSQNYASARSCGNLGIGSGGYQTRFVTNFSGSGGGAGWLSDGNNFSTSAYAGGGDRWAGGSSSDGSAMDGGFGGGGGSNGSGNAGGGGGGYTGGGAGDGWQSMSSATGGAITRNAWGGGAGGGMFINSSATSVTKTAGVNGTNSYSNGTIVIL